MPHNFWTKRQSLSFLAYFYDFYKNSLYMMLVHRSSEILPCTTVNMVKPKRNDSFNFSKPVTIWLSPSGWKHCTKLITPVGADHLHTINSAHPHTHPLSTDWEGEKTEPTFIFRFTFTYTYTWKRLLLVQSDGTVKMNPGTSFLITYDMKDGKMFGQHVVCHVSQLNQILCIYDGPIWHSDHLKKYWAVWSRY